MAPFIIANRTGKNKEGANEVGRTSNEPGQRLTMSKAMRIILQKQSPFGKIRICKYVYEVTHIEAIRRTNGRGTILKGLRVYKPILTTNKEKKIFEMEYKKLPFVHKLVIMMTHSFNELMRSIYGTCFCPYVRICIIEVSSDDSCLHFYLLNNGIDVGDRKVTIDKINTLDESDILRHINRELAFQEANNNYEEDQRHPMQNASDCQSSHFATAQSGFL